MAFQRAHLIAKDTYEPGIKDEAVSVAMEDRIGEQVGRMRHRIADMNLSKGMLTMGWMRSALFLRMVALLRGDEGFDTLKEAIWAYTAALVDNLGKACADPGILSGLKGRRRYEAYRKMVRTLEKGVGVQLRLLSEVGAAKVRYRADEAALEYGRRLIRTVHFPDYRGGDFVAFADALSKFGPGGVPGMKDEEWKQAVALAKAVLEYEANNAQ